MAQKGFDKMKAFFESGGSALDFSNLFPEFTYDPPDPNKKKDPGGGGDDPIEKKKSAMRTLLEGMSQGWVDFFAKQDESWTTWGESTKEIMMNVGNFTSELTGKIDAIGQQRHKNKMMSLDNEYNKEISNLDGMNLSEEKYQKKKDAIDKRFAEKRKQLEIKEAKRAKKIAIFNAIIATAMAVAKQIPNAYMMALAGVMGAAQVATIASQPIPMAKGALAFSPVNAIVGDNPNAKNDPEVIAPLSKLSEILGIQNSNVNVTGTISGNDVVLSSSKANISLARYA